MIDKSDVAQFWEDYAQRTSLDGTSGLSNLEKDPTLNTEKINTERRILADFLRHPKPEVLLDLGAGCGEWALFFQQAFKKVIAYEQSDVMCDIFRKRLLEGDIDNINLIQEDISCLESVPKFDLALLSGILIYLDDSHASQLISVLRAAAKPDSAIVVRDATGTKGDYMINGAISEALGAPYYAYYRSRTKYLTLFEDHGFQLTREQNMFPDRSRLNKWSETRLRVYRFSAPRP